MPVRTSSPASTLVGDVRIPGDGAVARVAVLLATAATGVSVVDGLPPGPRTDRLLAAAAALGAGVERTGDVARITGAGLGTLAEPSAPLDAGDDRALMALLLGLAATHPSTLVLTGDGAPLTDVIAPLARMGAAVPSAAVSSTTSAPKWRSSPAIPAGSASSGTRVVPGAFRPARRTA